MYIDESNSLKNIFESKYKPKSDHIMTSKSRKQSIIASYPKILFKI